MRPAGRAVRPPQREQRQQQEQRERKAQAAEIRQLIEAHRLDRRGGESVVIRGRQLGHGGSEAAGRLHRDPVGAALGLVTGDPLAHLRVQGLGGDDHNPAGGWARQGLAEGEARLAGPGAAEDEGQAHGQAPRLTNPRGAA